MLSVHTVLVKAVSVHGICPGVICYLYLSFFLSALKLVRGWVMKALYYQRKFIQQEKLDPQSMNAKSTLIRICLILALPLMPPHCDLYYSKNLLSKNLK